MKKLLLILFLISSINVFAQKGKPHVFSLVECIDHAAKNNPQLRLTKEKIYSAESKLTNAFGMFLPAVNYRAGYTRRFEDSKPTQNNDDPILPPELANLFKDYGSQENTFTMNAIASVDIFNGFSREANYTKTELELESAKLDIDITASDILRTIYKQYIEIVKYAQIVKIRRENLETGRKDLERTKARQQAGVAARGDVYAQEAEVGNRELELVQAENNMNIAKANILTTMGLNPDLEAEFLEKDIPAELSEEEIKKFRLKIGNLGKAVEQAYKNRQEFSKSDMDIQASKENITIANASYFPTLSLSGGWYWTNSKFAEFSERGTASVSVDLNYPIFQGFNTDYQVQTAELQYTMKELERIQLDQQIRGAIHTQMLNLEAAEKQIEITGRSLKSAELNFESSKKRYEVGTFNIIDYINSNYLVVSARINRVNAIYNYIQAQNEVLYAIGSLK